MVCLSLGSLKIEEGTLGSDWRRTSFGDGKKEIWGASHRVEGKDHRCQGEEQISQVNHTK